MIQCKDEAIYRLIFVGFEKDLQDTHDWGKPFHECPFYFFLTNHEATQGGGYNGDKSPRITLAKGDNKEKFQTADFRDENR